MSQWYLKGKQKNYGPYSNEQLVKLFETGKIKTSTLLAKDQTNWVRLDNSPVLNKLTEVESPPESQDYRESKSNNNELGLSLVPLEEPKSENNLNNPISDDVTPSLSMVEEAIPQETLEINTPQLNVQAEHAEDLNQQTTQTQSSPPRQQEQPEVATSSEAGVMYNDLYMIALVLLPLLITGGLLLGLPKSVLGIIFSIVAIGLVYVDRESLKKFDFEPPHWLFALVPPMYLKQREKIQENPYFFTLSTVASLALAATVFMYGTNESSSFKPDDLAYNYKITNDPIINDLKAHDLVERAGRKTVIAVYFVKEKVAIIDDNYKLKSISNSPAWQPRVDYLNPTSGDEEQCGSFTAWRMKSKNILEFKALKQSEGSVFSSETFYEDIKNSENNCANGTIKSEIFNDGTVILDIDVVTANDMMLLVYGSTNDDESMAYDLSAGFNTLRITTVVALEKGKSLDNW